MPLQADHHRQPAFIFLRQQQVAAHVHQRLAGKGKADLPEILPRFVVFDPEPVAFRHLQRQAQQLRQLLPGRLLPLPEGHAAVILHRARGMLHQFQVLFHRIVMHLIHSVINCPEYP